MQTQLLGSSPWFTDQLDCVLYIVLFLLSFRSDQRFESHRAWIEVVVKDPLLDHWIVDDVPDSVLETPASSPVIAQKAAKKGAKVLGKGKDARSKDKERDCTHPEPRQVDG